MALKWNQTVSLAHSLIKVRIRRLSLGLTLGCLFILGDHILELWVRVEACQEAFEKLIVNPVCLCPFHLRQRIFLILCK